MSLHDAYARLTPFEIAFPDRRVVEELSAEVAREVEARGGDDSLLETFVTTGAVRSLARAIRGPDAAPESTFPFATLLYHAVHFVRAGYPLHLLTTAAVRRLARPDAVDADTAIEPPETAGYLQLPQHLMWTAAVGAGRDAPPESLDGVFWTLSGSGMLYALPISGVLPERPGFGALPLPAAPMADAAAWLNADVRASGDDFRGALPGGELDRLYAVEAAGEVLKLLARFFVEARGAGAAREQPAPFAGGPRPSALPYTRVSPAR